VRKYTQFEYWTMSKIRDVLLFLTIPLLTYNMVVINGLKHQLHTANTQNEALVVSVSDLTTTNMHLTTKLTVTKRNIKTAKRHGKAKYIAALLKMEVKYNMPSGILQNIAYHESRYNPNAVSHKGAIGIMQIHPRWHPNINPYDPYASIRYGAKYLNSLYKKFNDWEVALAAWNWGQGNIMRHSFYKAPRETRDFIKNVMKGIKI